MSIVDDGPTADPSADRRQTPTFVELGVREIALVNGEILIGKIFFDHENRNFVIEHPARAIVERDPTTGRQNVKLQPQRPWTNSEVALPISSLHVVYVVEVVQQMQDAYAQSQSSIVVPDTKIVGASSLDQILKS